MAAHRLNLFKLEDLYSLEELQTIALKHGINIVGKSKYELVYRIKVYLGLTNPPIPGIETIQVAKRIFQQANNTYFQIDPKELTTIVKILGIDITDKHEIEIIKEIKDVIEWTVYDEIDYERLYERNSRGYPAYNSAELRDFGIKMGINVNGKRKKDLIDEIGTLMGCDKIFNNLFEQ